MIDLHCHILPGLDDGPGSFDESLAMARMACADGTTVIVATPHVDERLCYPEPERIRELAGRLNELVRAEGLGLRVLPGAEARVAPELVERLVAGQVMTVGDQGKYVLVELPTSGQAVFVGELFFRMQVAGYVPIIAHAERVDWFRREPRVLESFRDRGVRLQVNAESVSGRAGRGCRNVAIGLVKAGLADVIGSDGHNVSSRKPLLSVAQRNLRGLNGAFERLTVMTPGGLLGAKVANLEVRPTRD